MTRTKSTRVESGKIQNAEEGRPAPARIVTFYSFKGGVGRTMALANVAWILASAGKRVLAIDWDLDSPGLHRYFRPFLRDRDLTGTTGVIDMLLAHSQAASKERGRSAAELDTLRQEHAMVADHVQRLDWDGFPDGGLIDFLGSGRQNTTYDFNVATFPWGWLLDRPDGVAFIEALRDGMRNGAYDYVLVDSRTGTQDIVGICTELLPDVVMLCLSMHNQAIEGGARAAGRIRERARRDVRVVPVLTRADQDDWERKLRRLKHVRRLFEGPLAALVGDDQEAQLRHLSRLQVPYRAFYSYTELLAVFGDQLDGARMMLGAYENLASIVSDGQITRMPSIPITRANQIVRAFEQLSSTAPRRVAVWAAPQDRAWRDWVGGVLREVGVEVVAPDAVLGDPPADARVIIVSPQVAAPTTDDSIAQSWVELAGPVTDADDLALVVIRVAEGPVPEAYEGLAGLSLASRKPESARGALLERLGLPVSERATTPTPGRYPGEAPTLWNVQIRDRLFVGRDTELATLREMLDGGLRVPGRCVLTGPRGFGKSSLAREFAHRYGTDYDLVWWTDAADPGTVRDGLAALASRLGPQGARAHTGPTERAEHDARDALDALRRGDPHSRWLLVYDGAVDPAALDRERLIPDTGPGRHVIITSRAEDWDALAATLAVPGLPRDDSMVYLGLRLPGAARDDLNAIAEDMGDVPLELANAAGSISAARRTSRVGIAAAIEQFRSEVARTAGGVSAWSVGYTQLRDADPRAQASARLLEILAYLSPLGASMRLVMSPAMLERVGYEPEEAEPLSEGLPQLLQALHERSLALLDPQGSTVRVHQAVQEQMRVHLAAEGREGEVRAAALSVLAAYAPPSSQPFDTAHFPVYEELQKHLASSSAAVSTAPDVRMWLLYQLFYLNRSGQWTRARVLGEECLRRWRASAGENDMLTLRLATNLANTYRSLARFSDAFDLDSSTLARQRREFGFDNPATLRTALNLGSDKRSLGWYRDAWAEDQATWDGYQRVRGPEHSTTIVAAQNLAMSLLLSGETHQALILSREVLETRQRLLGPDASLTAWAKCQTAICLRELGQGDESLALLQSAAATLESNEGPLSHFALRVRKQQAVTLRALGDLAVAADLTESTLARFREQYGDEDLGTIGCALSFAADLNARAETGQAVATATECLDAYTGKYGADHPFTHSCRTNLALYLLADGDTSGAVTSAEKAFTWLSQRLFPHHPFAVAAAVNYGNALVSVGEVAAAADLDTATAATASRNLGADHPSTRAATANRADCVTRLGGGLGARRAQVEIDIHTI